MNTFTVNQYGVIVTDTNGDKVMVRKDSSNYNQARNAVMCADWDTFYQIAEIDSVEVKDDDGPLSPEMSTEDVMDFLTQVFKDDIANDDSPEFEAEDSFQMNTIATTLANVKGLLSDGLISPEDIITEDNLDQFADAMPQSSDPSHEHDLSQWNGSPIFYPTREMAREQSDRWGMFWDYHDFGIASPAGYRYATVPRGVGPTAPEGYDWVCLPREE